MKLPFKKIFLTNFILFCIISIIIVTVTNSQKIFDINLIVFLVLTIIFSIIKKNPIYTFFRTIFSKRYKLSTHICRNELDLEIESKTLIENLCKSIATAVPFNFTYNANVLDKYLKYRKKVSRYQIECIFDSICKYLKLNKKYIDFEICTDMPLTPGVVGEFEPKGNMAGKVTLYYSKTLSIEMIVSILVHECCHAFCHVNNYMFDRYTEEITDLLCIYFGFYDIFIVAYQQITELNRAYFANVLDFKIGYLTADEIEIAYNCFKQTTIKPTFISQ